MANFPLVTWEIDLPGFSIQVGAGSPVPYGPSTGYGYELLSLPDVPAALTPPGYLSDCLGLTPGVSNVSRVYNITNNTVPATTPLTATITYDCASPMILTFATLEDAAVYGFNYTTINLPPGTGATVTTQYNKIGRAHV